MILSPDEERQLSIAAIGCLGVAVIVVAVAGYAVFRFVEWILW